jgi:hydroxymethylpyrimidine/phosphomethylpyrimidine kinase
MNHLSNGRPPVVLTIAGFDPSGGAGIAADLKTFAANGCYGVAAITALTVQNTRGVSRLSAVDPSLVKDSIESVLADGQVKAIKIGMLANRANAEVVCTILETQADVPAVLDPVWRSAGGMRLMDAAGFEFLRRHMLARVTAITPNLDEAGALTDSKVENVEEMKRAARQIVQMGARAVVVTGGHLDKAIDVYFDGTELETFVGERVKPDNTHGTGCTFSSAIAANLALGRQLRDAVMLAKAYVAESIKKAYPIGPGRLPLNHFYRLQQPSRIIDHATTLAEPVR